MTTIQENGRESFVHLNLICLENLISSWTSQKHNLVINIMHHYDNITDSTEILVQNFNSSLCIPITFTTQKYPNFENTSSHAWLWNMSSEVIKLNFKEDGWINF